MALTVRDTAALGRRIGPTARAWIALAAAGALGACAITPQPITDDERLAQAKSDMAAMFAEQEPLRRPLTIDEAFARALAYNLDQRVKLIEIAVNRDDLNLFALDLLPKVVANATVSHRNNIEASSSTSVITNQQSLEPSTSNDRNKRFSDLTLSWNVLDFGVSYFNARQQADRTLAVEEQRRRTIQLIFQEVRRAFWRAAGAQRLAGEVRTAIADAQRALASGRKLESEALRAPIDALRYQKAMLDLLRQLEAIERQLASAKVELAALINLPPGTKFVLAIPPERLERLRVPVSAFEDYALLHNPDIREQAYQTRISADETRKALVKLLPGVTMSYGRFYDANSFLVNHAWTLGAARLAVNMVNLVYAPYTIRRGRDFEAFADLKRQAISMTVLAKVHVSYLRYLAATKEYRTMAELAQVDRRLYRQIANRAETDAQSELEQVSAKVSAVFSDVRRYQAYAEMQSALGQLYASLGVDPLPHEIETLDIGALTRAIGEQARERLADAAPAVPEAPEKPAEDAMVTAQVPSGRD